MVPTVTAQIAYGEERIFARLPERTRTLAAPRPLAALPDPARAVREALADPIAHDQIPKLVGPSSRVLIAFDDPVIPQLPMKRPDFRELAIPILIQELEKAGVRRRNITLVCANGLHRKWTPSELATILGTELVQAFGPSHLYCHDAEDRENLAFLGETERGLEVEVNRAVVDSDQVFYVNITSLPFHGGWKSVAVGLSSFRSIRHHHRPFRAASGKSVMDARRSSFQKLVWELGSVIEEHLARDDSGVELDDVRVVRLPEGRDPDEVLRDEPDRWREDVRTARPIVDHLIDVHARAHDLRTPGGQTRFVDAVLPIIRNLPNPVMRDAYLGQVHRISGVEERTLLEALYRRAGRDGDGRDGRDGRDRFTAEAVTRAPDALPVTEILRGVSPTEQALLRLVLLVPETHDAVLNALGPDRLPSQVARELYRAIVLARAPDDAGVRPLFSLPTILEGLDEESRALGQALLSRPGPDLRGLGDRSLAYEIERLILEIEFDDLEARAAWVAEELAEAERRGDTETVTRLANQQRDLHQQRRSLDRRRDQTRLLARAAVAAG